MLSESKTTKTNEGVEQGDGGGVGVRTIPIENAELRKLLQNPKSSEPLVTESGGIADTVLFSFSSAFVFCILSHSLHGGGSSSQQLLNPFLQLSDQK